MIRILLISMPSIHFIRWVTNIDDSKFELYWFDILNRGKIEEISNMTQFYDWKKRKKSIFKGEYTLSKKAPAVYGMIEPVFQTTVKEQLTKIISEVKPNIVHSFQMQDCTYPILKTMKSFKDVPWIYSCWGSDLFFYKDQKKHKRRITDVLKRLNYFHADNQRDCTLAKELGFKGEFFGIFPGGGGYPVSDMNQLSLPLSERNVILVKGYQHYFGRATFVLEALKKLKEEIAQYRVIVFGAHDPIFKYQSDFENIEIYHRNELDHKQLFEIMSRSKIYIGNSISDGVPNTLLESMIMGVFPIQSNPGNVTAELIVHGENGFLIEDPNSISEIKNHIASALSDEPLLENAQIKNKTFAKKKLDNTLIRDKINLAYLSIVKS